MIKLNGGLGTSMGLDRAKSLLEVRDGLSFLDIIARQVLAAREEHDVTLPLVFMNSWRTRDDTAARARGLRPRGRATCRWTSCRTRSRSSAPTTSPRSSGRRTRTSSGARPGTATSTPPCAAAGCWTGSSRPASSGRSCRTPTTSARRPTPGSPSGSPSSGAPFAIEAVRRTPSDRKGGHFARRTSDERIVLRETAQTLDEDKEALADLSRHRYCSTNNLWFDLEAMRDELDRRDGVLGLAMIKNTKTVDPADADSPEVIQIETAMGAAIEVFDGSQLDRGDPRRGSCRSRRRTTCWCCAPTATS